MKDNGKGANRSALIMRQASRATAEDFWFILLNSPVALKGSRFNCSWFWEALASEEVKCFTRIGKHCFNSLRKLLPLKVGQMGTLKGSLTTIQFHHLNWSWGKKKKRVKGKIFYLFLAPIKILKKVSKATKLPRADPEVFLFKKRNTKENILHLRDPNPFPWNSIPSNRFLCMF